MGREKSGPTSTERMTSSSVGSTPFICWWISRRCTACRCHPRCRLATSSPLRSSRPQAHLCWPCSAWWAYGSGGWMNDPLMQAAMPDTFFTDAPDWTWWILLYFFIGGIAGTAFMLASLLDWQSRGASPLARPTVRNGYYLAFIGVVTSGLLLIIDLTRPLRFWHMVLENHTGQLMFKAWEPMSVGVWGLLLFGVFAFLAALSVVGEDRPSIKVLRSAPVRFLRRRGPAAVIAVLGTISGLFIAGYTGVLLAVTNRPIWADSNLLGLVSGASTGAAALILMALRNRTADQASLGWLVWFDRNVLILELLVLIA